MLTRSSRPQDGPGNCERYLRWANAFLVVYSIDDRESFEGCRRYLDVLARHARGCQHESPVLLLGNKLDMEQYRYPQAPLFPLGNCSRIPLTWVKSSDLRVWVFLVVISTRVGIRRILVRIRGGLCGRPCRPRGDALAWSPPLFLVGCFFSCVIRQRQHALGFELQLLAGCLCCCGTSRACVPLVLDSNVLIQPSPEGPVLGTCFFPFCGDVLALPPPPAPCNLAWHTFLSPACPETQTPVPFPHHHTTRTSAPSEAAPIVPRPLRRQVTKAEGMALASKFGCLFYEVSACQDFAAVQHVFHEAVREVRREAERSVPLRPLFIAEERPCLHVATPATLATRQGLASCTLNTLSTVNYKEIPSVAQAKLVTVKSSRAQSKRKAPTLTLLKGFKIF